MIDKSGQGTQQAKMMSKLKDLGFNKISSNPSQIHFDLQNT